ncbi:MAG: hypothetical protein JRC69_02220 [Deltaproteobacteria bacterium]|nr:hypothetical protein [Deltaproteobacteria bacterium]
MATKRPKQVKKLKFELTRSAVVGIGVVSFCLFLWMFLIGVWAGQSLLLPSYGKKVATVDKSVDELSEPLVIKADKKAVKK